MCEPAVKIILVKFGRTYYCCYLVSQRNKRDTSSKLKLSSLYFLTLKAFFFFFFDSVLHFLLYFKCKIGTSSPAFLTYILFFSQKTSPPHYISFLLGHFWSQLPWWFGNAESVSLYFSIATVFTGFSFYCWVESIPNKINLPLWEKRGNIRKEKHVETEDHEWNKEKGCKGFSKIKRSIMQGSARWCLSMSWEPVGTADALPGGRVGQGSWCLRLPEPLPLVWV